MNDKLADLAERRISEHAEPTTANWCQRWVRLTVEAIYGKRYEALLHQPSARLAALAFVAAQRSGDLPPGVEVIVGGTVKDTQLGDLLYKLGSHDAAPGHVGIRVRGNRVAENSSTSLGRVYRALGFRTLSQYGKIDVIVRLPAA